MRIRVAVSSGQPRVMSRRAWVRSMRESSAISAATAESKPSPLNCSKRQAHVGDNSSDKSDSRRAEGCVSFIPMGFGSRTGTREGLPAHFAFKWVPWSEGRALVNHLGRLEA